jgi:hypothetical protein
MRVSRGCLAGDWAPLRPVRCDEGSRLSAAVVSPAPSVPGDYSRFGQAGIFVEFTGLVAYLVHYRAPDPPLSPDPPPRWERCDGTDQRASAAVTGALPSRSRGGAVSGATYPPRTQQRGTLDTRVPYGTGRALVGIAIISSSAGKPSRCRRNTGSASVLPRGPAPEAQDQAGRDHSDTYPDQRPGDGGAKQDPGRCRGDRSHAGEQAGLAGA